MEVYSTLVAFAIFDISIHPYHRLKWSQFGEKPYKVRIAEYLRQSSMGIDSISAAPEQEITIDESLATLRDWSK